MQVRKKVKREEKVQLHIYYHIYKNKLADLGRLHCLHHSHHHRRRRRHRSRNHCRLPESHERLMDLLSVIRIR